MQMGIISPAAECVILCYWVCHCVSFHLLINLIFVKCCSMDSTVKWNLRESLRLEQERNSCQSCAVCPKILVAINTESMSRSGFGMWTHTQQIYRELWIFFLLKFVNRIKFLLKLPEKRKTTYMKINVKINTSINSWVKKSFRKMCRGKQNAPHISGFSEIVPSLR